MSSLNELNYNLLNRSQALGSSSTCLNLTYCWHPSTCFASLIMAIRAFLLLFMLFMTPGCNFVEAAPFNVLVKNAGIASMHTAVTHTGTVILLDRTDIGASEIKLPDGKCRIDPNDLTLKKDCTAHSVMFTPGPNTIRPLTILTDTWCSSGQFLADGTLLQTGGDFDGLYKIRRLTPCKPSGTCDWVEDQSVKLKDPRWYATNQLLPDGRVIVVGGINVYTYEFVPRASGEGSYNLELLKDTKDNAYDNLYPFVHLLPDGTLFIFANRDSIIFNYVTGAVVRKLPTIPGEPRNYPSAGSSVLLPLQSQQDFAQAEVLVCGGARLGAYRNPTAQYPCSQTCGRIHLSSLNAAWAMETMPYRRCMGDMILLPNRQVVIINGAENGSQGWGLASNPALSPVIYDPDAASGQRFELQPAGTIPRMYHSTANLLPDGRILLAGSNTHEFYTFTGAFPTELRVEAWSPPYLDATNNPSRPTILSAAATVKYGQTFTISFSIPDVPTLATLEMNLISAPFTTHSFAMGQRCLRLNVAELTKITGTHYTVIVTAPPNTNVAPASYYMLFPVHSGIPGAAVWVQVTP